jgi:hypothetical protein
MPIAPATGNPSEYHDRPNQTNQDHFVDWQVVVEDAH